MANSKKCSLAQASVDIGLLASQLSDKSLGRGLTNALRKEARRVRKVAQKNLRSTQVRYTAALGRTISAGVRSDARGIFVSVRANKKSRQGMYLTRRGVYKPVLLFMADGTAERKTKKGRYTGLIDKQTYGGFHEAAIDNEGPRISSNVYSELEKQIEKQARKYVFS